MENRNSGSCHYSMIRVFQCEDSLTGILTGVYDAWQGGKGYDGVRLTAGGEDPELFCCYEEVKSDPEKAGKVWRTVHRRMGEEAEEMIARAAACPEPDKADAIFRMIVLGLHLPDGREAVRALSRPEVMKMMELGRKAGNIAMRYMEILRFEELENGVLLGKADPEADVLALMAPHFADRFPLENWMIYDVRRKKAAVHPKRRQWYLVEEIPSELIDGLQKSSAEKEMQKLWKCFYQTIAIPERANAKLQTSLIPLKYRDFMSEFKKTDFVGNVRM